MDGLFICADQKNVIILTQKIGLNPWYARVTVY